MTKADLYDMSYSMRSYYKKILEHRCSRCGKPRGDSTTLECPACRQKRLDRDRTEHRKASISASRKILYNKRKEAGLCVTCGKPAIEGRVHCETHATYSREHTRLYKKKKRGEVK